MIISIKRRCLIVVLLFASTSLFGSSQYAEKGLFYLARKGSYRVWLFGGVHLANASAYPLPDRVMEAYKESDGLMEELDMKKLDRRAMAQILYREGMATKPLRETVGEELYARTAKAAAEHGLKIETIEKFRPWFIAITMGGFQMRRGGYSQIMGIDAFFAQQAATDGKPPVALETAADQLAIFGKLTPNEERLLLESTIASLETSPSSESETEEVDVGPDEIMKAWLTGDESKISRLTKLRDGSTGDFSSFETALFRDRNVNMANQIDAHRRAGRTLFVVIGAGHLPPPWGVPRYLEALGYQVERR